MAPKRRVNFLMSTSDLSKEKQLYQAVADGDLETVKTLASDEAVDINWAAAERSDTPLHHACRIGHLEIVKELLAHPRIEVNKGNVINATPLFPSRKNKALSRQKQVNHLPVEE